MSSNWWEKACVVVGRPMVNGYSRIYVGGARVYVHRHVWEQTHGPIPPGQQVHHLCRNKRCSNVKHLELVGISEHPSLHPPPPQCQKCGEEDWYERPDGGRECRACRKTWRRKRYHSDAAYRAKHIRVSNASARRRNNV